MVAGRYGRHDGYGGYRGVASRRGPGGMGLRADTERTGTGKTAGWRHGRYEAGGNAPGILLVNHKPDRSPPQEHLWSVRSGPPRVVWWNRIDGEGGEGEKGTAARRRRARTDGSIDLLLHSYAQAQLRLLLHVRTYSVTARE